MKIGIIGAGNIGSALTRRFTAAGHQVFLANSRGPQTLTKLAAETGAKPVNVKEAAHAGDAAYNDVHLHLGESNAETRKDWIAALDTIESLKPVAVIAGQKRPGAPDTPNNIEETRKYIRDFDRIAANTRTALELYSQMIAIYPGRLNPEVLWLSARAMKPGT